MRCNYNCDYCCQTFVEGRKPIHKEVGFISWVRFIKRFPYRIKEISVSGGEPTLHRDFVRIVKYLLSCGYFVKVFTNLSNVGKLLEIPKCVRLHYQITYHHSINKDDFLRNYKKLKGYRVTVDEIGFKILPFSKLIKEQTPDWNFNFNNGCLRVSPNLRINLNCYQLISQKLDYELN